LHLNVPISWFLRFCFFKWVNLWPLRRGGVHPKADEWVISASQEAAGECLALNGGGGWVDLRLREAVAVEAVTLEHIHRQGGARRELKLAP
jgi:hypothetical protein